ncbi:hypothetical protein G3O08_12240 [Cryomorpha ignava]|uniref:Uncharacterized protein n=1 Tax=Cryomorpha ignava TaxID=101383 RepID=A0A7K3WRH2_9FLAO|nr:hypothetical protein [Cryomorpha ignava]NEN24273.1 hypothetical protein [Cryomorpha ignava]
MTEIKIEKKQPVWPWIIVILVILAVVSVVYFFFLKDDDTADVATDKVEMVNEEQTIKLSESAISEITDYTSFIGNEANMSLDHEYTHGALDRLIDATEAVSNSLDIDLRADLETARANAGDIEDDPYEVDHANTIENAANIIFQALKKIQVQKFPDLDESCAEVGNAASAIAPDTQTLNQKDAINDFFQKAGQLLTNMKNK